MITSKRKREIEEEIQALETLLQFYQMNGNKIKSMNDEQKVEHMLDIMERIYNLYKESNLES